MPFSRFSIVLMGMALFPCLARAMDVSPGSYTAAPPGTNIGIWYQQYGRSDRYSPDGAPDSSHDTGTKSNTSILRLIHYTEIGGIVFNPQLLLSHTNSYDGKINGQQLESASGFGDPMTGATFWLVNQPSVGRYVGVTTMLTLPLGSYHRYRGANIGQNRWVGNLQVGWVEPVWQNLYLELFGDVVTYSDNDEAGNGRQTLKQDDSFQFQSYLRYAFSPVQSFAVGFSAWDGGKRYLDGRYNGQKTEFQQVRLDAQRRFTKNFFLGAQVTHDTQVTGGFRKDLGMTLRFMFVY